MALKFAMILETVDRMSGPGRRALASIRNLARGTRDLVRGGAAGGRALDRLRATAGRLRAGLGPLMTRLRHAAGRAGMKALELGAYGAGRAIGWTIRKVAGLAVGLAKLAAGSIGLAGGGFLGSVLATTAQFEQFQIMLENMEGSSEKAKASMAWVTDFAKRTPYELEQVMQAFVQLKAYGIDPLDGSLTAAGDAASGMSKDLMQAVEALADAQTGEFERLKDFAIRASADGNKVRFKYVKDGKEMVREVENNAEAIKAAVTSIWTERFGGMMDRQSKTFTGMISNLKGAWSDFLLRVGQAGVFDNVKAKLESVLKWLDAKLADGSLAAWAETVSKKLEEIVNWVGKFTEKDWARFAGDLWGIAKAVWSIAKAFASAVNWASNLVNTQDKIARNGATTTVDGGLFRIRRANEAPPAPAKPMMPAVRSSPRASPINLRGTMVSPAALRPQAALAAPAAPLTGKVVLEVRTAPGTSVKARELRADNGSIGMVYRGRAMAWHG